LECIDNMFARYDVRLMSNPVCSKPVEGLEEQDFFYYDKDGFELNQAERKFYTAMNYPINNPILNHCCWQETWFKLIAKDSNLILDHSMFLCRCSYEQQALEQLNQFKTQTPQADLLIKTRQKWGFDFALDAVHNGEIFEVIHIEYDNYDYEYFNNRMIHFDYIVRHTDWNDAAKRVWQQRDQWQHLKGFEQNNWKAKFLLGWNKAEYTEKTI